MTLRMLATSPFVQSETDVGALIDDVARFTVHVTIPPEDVMEIDMAIV